MATLLRLRLRDGSDLDLAFEREWFVDADVVRIDAEIDVRAWIAIDGLVDAHAHLGAQDVKTMVDTASLDPEALRSRAAAQLAGGVLTVADKGARSDDHLALLAEPLADVPDLHMAATMISAPGGYYEDFGAQVPPADLHREVERQTATPASWVKIVGDWPRKGEGVVVNFDEEALARAVAAAHGAGRRVAIHTMGRDAPSAAVRAGVDSIEHGLFLTVDDLEALAARGGHWVPTVVAMEGTIGQLRPGSTGAAMIGEGLDNVRSLLPVAVEMGVTILTGTDLVLGHGMVAHEAVRLVEYGLGDAAAFEAATNRAAFGAESGFMSGRPADLVLVDGDPAERIEFLTRPAGVMRRGRWVIKP